MKGYIINHNLSYKQFADIINKLPCHNLNFDKNFVKYYCKKIIQNLTIHQEKFLHWKKICRGSLLEGEIFPGRGNEQICSWWMDYPHHSSRENFGIGRILYNNKSFNIAIYTSLNESLNF